MYEVMMHAFCPMVTMVCKEWSSIRLLNEHVKLWQMVFHQEMLQGLKIRKQRSTGDLDRKGVMGRCVSARSYFHLIFPILQHPINGLDLVMDVKRVKLRGRLRHVGGQPGKLRRGGRDAGCECDGDVHGRVEERQEVRVRNQRTLGRSQVRGRVV